MTTRTKYNVDKDISKRTYDGITFDSVLEMKYYRDVLCPLVKSGDVVNYELQKPYELQPKFIHDNKTVQPIKYVADFFIVYKNGHEEVIDTKGYNKSDDDVLYKLTDINKKDDENTTSENNNVIEETTESNDEKEEAK